MPYPPQGTLPPPPAVGAIIYTDKWGNLCYGSTYDLYILKDSTGTALITSIKLPSSGKLYNFMAIVTANSLNAASKVAANIGGDTTTISISIPASATGTFTSTAAKTVSAGTSVMFYFSSTAATAGFLSFDYGTPCIAFR